MPDEIDYFRTRQYRHRGDPVEAQRGKWSEVLHPRLPSGHGGGEFASKDEHHGALGMPVGPQYGHGSHGGALAMHASVHDAPLPPEQETARRELRALQQEHRGNGIHLDQSKHALNALSQGDYVGALRHFQAHIGATQKRGQGGGGHPLTPPKPRYAGYESTDYTGSYAGASPSP